ncbi:MAG: FIST C-terminal domain-containing protein [Planctomycetes bacterium]|nr:FIST C-terminal domain-containing protein [Planctomycetota bacterium]
MQASGSQVSLKMATGSSGNPDTVYAARAACEQCRAGLGEGEADLAMVFFSPHHLTSVSQLAATVQRRLAPRHIIGVGTEGVIAGPYEHERSAGISILAASLPGVEVRPFSSEQFPASDDSAESLFMLRDVIGAAEDLRFTLLLVDPFSVPLIKLIPDLNRARVGGNGVLFGGLASAAASPGGNAMILDDTIATAGAVGVSLKGNLRVDTIVSQGCKPFGPNFVVTKCKGNLVMELGGKPAVEAIQGVLNEQGEARHSLLSGGLFVGRVIDEYKSHFGRDDFLIRKVVGVRPEEGAIAVADFFRVGQTIRLFTRDGATADQDLAMLLDKQKLYDKPKGAMVVTCNGRGRRMFKQPHHDASSIVKAFRGPVAGEELSKPGTPYYSASEGKSDVPVAGFFATGEIGPVGGQSFVHGQTACVALFRDNV